MDAELKFGMMALFIRANGKTTRRTEKVDSFMPTEMFMKENGLMIRLMGREFTLTLMELNTLATGRKISKMERVLNHGLIMLAMKEIINKEKNLVMENLNGLMDLSMKVSLLIIT